MTCSLDFLMNHLPLLQVLFPTLKHLTLSAINVVKIWCNPHLKLSSSVQNLTRLTIQDCHNLKLLFSSSLVTSLVRLQFLEICRCPVLEEIIVVDNPAEKKNINFPRLKWLRIEDLQNLRRFSAGIYVQFPALKQLDIKKCPQLIEFIFNDEVDYFKSSLCFSGLFTFFFLLDLYLNLVA